MDTELGALPNLGNQNRRLITRIVRDDVAKAALHRLGALKERLRHRASPGVQLVVEPGSTAAQLEALNADRCDIGFIAHTEIAEPLTSEPMTHDHLVALLPRDHALVSHAAVHFEQFSREPMLMFSRREEPAIYARHMRAYQDAGVTPQIVAEVDYADTLLALVAAGLGIAHAPSCVARLGMEGVVAIPIEPRTPSGIIVVWNEATLSPAARRFLAVLHLERDAATRSAT